MGLFALSVLVACSESSKPPPIDPGGEPPPTEPGKPACKPTSCEAQGKNCGQADDGCGNALDCGGCATGTSCGGGGKANVCGRPDCRPKNCAELGFNCGQAADGCGGILSCGACSGDETCGGGGKANVCGGGPTCTPKTCAQQGLNCGEASDGCGGMLRCGDCAAGETCGGGGRANVCGKAACKPTTCAAQGKECGSIPDGCGGTLECGACAEGKSCGAGGTPNICAFPSFGGPGPWPIDNITYGALHGILEQPVIGTTTDEAQNLWVATNKALYLLKPGWKQFKRFDSKAGLHLQDNPVAYCDKNFGGGDKSCPIYGAAWDPGILTIVGGAPNEVFVGYAGANSDPGDWSDPNRHSGKLDRVRLNADGTLQVDRFDLVSVNHGAQYWHNQSVYSMVYDHKIHPHNLYVGTNHGVDRLLPDKYRPPRPNEWFDAANREYMSDHLHARVCYHRACDNTESYQRMGDWRGLAIDQNGDLWTAGRWTAGLIRWDPDVVNWFMRSGSDAFVRAFGDPYPTAPNDEGFVNEPVFRVPLEGDPVNLGAVSVAPDGKVWFASGRHYGGDIAYGVAVWTGRSFKTYDPVKDIGMSDSSVLHLVALPDGRIALAGPNSGLVIWNPATGDKKVLRAGSGLPDDQVTRLELDTMVNPPALHVST
ncbi:MAG TPA: hypothetical protein VK447_06170, partial [Myxococcaceae bacterium]|nr:hypothetical protein [Myxococcaceae bacterium]